MGKPNPAKLANFPEVEVFVLVADPEGLILDSKAREIVIMSPSHYQSATWSDPVGSGVSTCAAHAGLAAQSRAMAHSCTAARCTQHLTALAVQPCSSL